MLAAIADTANGASAWASFILTSKNKLRKESPSLLFASRLLAHIVASPGLMYL